MKENYSLIFVAVIWDAGMHLGANCNPFWRQGRLGCVQLLSHVWLFATPRTAAHQASLSSLPPRVQIHVHWVSDATQPSHPLLSHLFLPSIFPSIRVFSNESALHLRWPKYWSFSFSISPSNEYSALISFRMDWLDLLAVQGLSRVLSNTTVQKHQFFSAQLSL